MKREEPRSARILGWIFTGVIFLCGIAFFAKFTRFAATLWEGGSEMLGFALMPVINYVLVATGFFLLLIYAFLKGEFSDVERAKYQLLEDNERYEIEERRWRQMEKQEKNDG